MPFDADDIAEFFDEDMPGHVAAECGGVAFPARLLKGGASDLSFVGADELALQCVAEGLPAGFAQGAEVTIDGVDYTIRDRAFNLCSADGRIVGYLLRVAA